MLFTLGRIFALNHFLKREDVYFTVTFIVWIDCELLLDVLPDLGMGCLGQQVVDQGGHDSLVPNHCPSVERLAKQCVSSLLQSEESAVSLRLLKAQEFSTIGQSQELTGADVDLTTALQVIILVMIAPTSTLLFLLKERFHSVLFVAV